MGGDALAEQHQHLVGDDQVTIVDTDEHLAANRSKRLLDPARYQPPSVGKLDAVRAPVTRADVSRHQPGLFELIDKANERWAADVERRSKLRLPHAAAKPPDM